MADVLKRTPPTVGVDLLFVDGEDYGDFTKSPNDVLIGSRYYGAHQAPGPKPLYAVLFDLIADKDLQIYQEGNSLVGAPEVVELVWDTAKDLGYAGYFIATPRHTLIDDHLELQKAGIRAIDVVDFDYPAWHTQYDTIDKVSGASLQMVGDVAVALIAQGGKGRRIRSFPPLKAPPRARLVRRESPHRFTVPPCPHPKLAPCCCSWLWRCSARVSGICSLAPVSLPVRFNSWPRCLRPRRAPSVTVPCGRAGRLARPSGST